MCTLTFCEMGVSINDVMKLKMKSDLHKESDFNSVSICFSTIDSSSDAILFKPILLKILLKGFSKLANGFGNDEQPAVGESLF